MKYTLIKLFLPSFFEFLLLTVLSVTFVSRGRVQLSPYAYLFQTICSFLPKGTLDYMERDLCKIRLFEKNQLFLSFPFSIFRFESIYFQY